MRILSALAMLSLLLAACGSSGPTPVSRGPRLEATLAAQWQTNSPPREVVFSRDGKVLATSEAAGQIVLRDTNGWKTLARFNQPGGTASLAFSKDGSQLFSGSYDGSIATWDLATAELVRELKGAERTVWSLDVSPDGTRLAAAGEDSLIRIWPLRGSGTPMVLRGHERNVWEVRFSPDGKRLASGSFDKSVRLWDAATGRLLKTLHEPTQAVVGLAYSPDGSMFATGGDDSTIRLWRASDGKLLRAVDNGNHAYKLAFSSDGRWLASGGRAHGGFGTFWHQATGGGGGAAPVHIWRTKDLALVAALRHGDDAPHVAFSPDGKWLVTSAEDNRVRVWRLTERN